MFRAQGARRGRGGGVGGGGGGGGSLKLSGSVTHSHNPDLYMAYTSRHHNPCLLLLLHFNLQ